MTAELEEQMGNITKAAELRQEAQSIRNKTLAQIPAGELRSAFETLTEQFEIKPHAKARRRKGVKSSRLGVFA